VWRSRPHRDHTRGALFDLNFTGRELLVTGQAWVEALQGAIRAFGESRRTNATVQITLFNGDKHYLLKAEPAGEDLVSLSPYPPDRADGLIRAATGLE